MGGQKQSIRNNTFSDRPLRQPGYIGRSCGGNNLEQTLKPRANELEATGVLTLDGQYRVFWGLATQDD